MLGRRSAPGASRALATAAAVIAALSLAGVPAAAAVDVDVAVVGAGLSGLWAARELRRHSNLSVVVLEGRGRVGGRTESLEPGTAKSVDLGAHWVGRTQYQIMSVIKQLGKETYTQYTHGTKVLELEGEGVRQYKMPIPTLPLLKEINFALFYAVADREVRAVPRGAPYNASNARHFDAMNVESFCSAWPWGRDTKGLVAAAMRTVMGKELADISALELLHYSACAGGLAPLLDASKGGAQEFKVVGGTQSLSIKLAEDLDVRLNSTVVSIEFAAEGGAATIRTLDGRTVSAKRVIVAVPPHLAAGIWYNPPLPAKKAQLLTHMTQGHLIKTIVTYDKAFWREQGLSGELVSSVFPLSICYDDTAPDGSAAALVCFVASTAAKKLSPLPKEERQAAVVDALVRYFGPEAAHVREYFERDWGLEPFTGGCPVGTMNAGAITQWGDALRETHGPVHFGGTETATWFYGFMNGAVQAGERCAVEVLEAFGLPVPQEMRDFYNMGGDQDVRERQGMAGDNMLWA